MTSRDRSTPLRTLPFFRAGWGCVFLLFCRASFPPPDWPSQAVAPSPPVQNVCGSVGAYLAYYAFLALGQGVFPVLFFTGVVLVMVACKSRIGDMWMRAVGLLLLSIAFASAVHHFSPGSTDGLPEGRGGVVGIATAAFLQHSFGTAGTRLVLLTVFLVGLLLAADDLVLRTPGFTIAAVTTVKERAPQINWNFGNIPRLPALPQFVTRDAVMKSPARRPADVPSPRGAVPTPVDPGTPLSRLASFLRGKVADRAGSVVLARKPARMKASVQVAADAVVATLNNADVDEDVIDLSYPEDDHAAAAADAAFVDDGDLGPSEAAVIPPPELQAPVRAAPVINRATVSAAAAGLVAFRLPPTPQPKPTPAGLAASLVTDDAHADDDTTDIIPPPSAAIPSAGAPALTDADGVSQPESPAIRQDIIVKLPNMLRPRQVAPPPPRPMELGEYQLPGWEFLDDAENG